jgi:hypothetical protein
MPATFFAFALLLLSAQPAPDPCPASSSAWIELSSVPDSLLVPPQFFFDQPTVPLEGLIVCPHGVFFNVHAAQDSVSREYYISFPVPTHEEFARSVPRDTALSVRAATDPHYVDRYVDRQVKEYTVRYNQLKTELRRLLGDSYVEGKRIDLAGTPARLKLGFPLTLLWDKESVPFYTYPGIYWRKE